MAVVKILVIPGSLRTGSLNARLAAVVAHEFALAGIDVERSPREERERQHEKCKKTGGASHDSLLACETIYGGGGTRRY